MSTNIAPGTRQHPWLAYLKHRRWWAFIVDPVGPSEPRLTEDNLDRLTEDGLVRITEGL